MKITLFLSAFWLFLAGLFTPPPSMAVVKGKVTDSLGEPIIAATVLANQNRTMVKGTATDVNGYYTLNLAPGVYEIEVTYVGYATKRISEVTVLAGQNQELNIVMDASESVLSEVVVVGRNAKKAEDRRSAMSATPTKTYKKTARGKAPATETTPATTPPVELAVYKPVAGETKPKSAEPAAPTDEIIIVDGRKKRAEILFDPETYEEKVRLIDVEEEAKTDVGETLADEMIAPGTIPQPEPRAGLLTAGEWNDLHNWSHHWTDLIADGEISAHENLYGFFPHHRYTLLLTNHLDVPMADVPVQLKSGGEIVWEARTDNTGKAELWTGLFDNVEKTNLTIEAWVNGVKQEVKNPKSAKSGFNFLKVTAECYAPKNVDIVWAVDATGSMGDELEYLKTELLDVIGRAKQKNPALDYRMGTAFYRDKGDEYIVKNSGLSPDISSTVEFIRKQYAGGGGDYLVRNLVGIDPANKMVAIGDMPETGTTMMFCRRDAQSARDDLLRMIYDLKDDLTEPPKAALYHACVGRGPNMFGEQGAEMRLIREHLGDIPLVGFFANGEIARDRLYGFTGILTVFK